MDKRYLIMVLCDEPVVVAFATDAERGEALVGIKEKFLAPTFTGEDDGVNDPDIVWTCAGCLVGG